MTPSPWFLSSEQRGERRVGGGGVWRQLNSSKLCREVLSARTCKGRAPGHLPVLWGWGHHSLVRNSCAWLCHTHPIPMGDTSTPTRVWLWALLSTTRMNMEICIISSLAAPVRSLGGEADSCRSPPCWPLALALLVTLEHSTLLPATGHCCLTHITTATWSCGTTMCGGLEGPPGPTTLPRKQNQRQAPPWSCCLEQGHSVALWQGQASCLGCWWGHSAAAAPPSNKVSYAGQRSGSAMYEPKAAFRPCPKLSLARV